MKFFSPFTLLAALLFSAVVVVPYLPSTRQTYDRFRLEVTIVSNQSGHVQLYPDSGLGFDEATSVRLNLAQSREPTVYRFALPTGTYRAFRLDPNDRDGTVTLASARIVDRAGRIFRTIDPAEFKPAAQIASLRQTAGRLEVVIAPGNNDPQLLVEFAQPVVVSASPQEVITEFLVRAGGVFIGLLALLLGLDRAAAARAVLILAGRRILLRPGMAVALVAAVAVVASAWPVVFLGRSYVSPNNGTILLYDGFPTLPGYTSAQTADVSGSDIGAVMWQHVRFSIMQRRALLAG